MFWEQTLNTYHICETAKKNTIMAYGDCEGVVIRLYWKYHENYMKLWFFAAFVKKKDSNKRVTANIRTRIAFVTLLQFKQKLILSSSP